MPQTPTLAQLILELGEKIPEPCSSCKQHALWLLDGGDKKEPAKVCSWCDVDVDSRWIGFKE